MEKIKFAGCHSHENINNYYEISKKELGKGTYGVVYESKVKDTNFKRAVKIIEKKKVTNIERFKSEVLIMNLLDHPNILRFYESYEDEKHYYLVLELCKGGELFDHIIQNNYYSEDDARIIFSQIMKALIYCHHNGISHRDLKPENFLMLTKSDPFSIKVIDFGLSKNFTKNININANDNSKIIDSKTEAAFTGRRNPKSKYIMNTKAGTPFYIAPEVLTGSYTEKCDVWSAGVILYILLCGYPPFYGNSNPEILEAVKQGKLDFSGPEWEGKSSEVFDLIRKMIVKSAEKRLSAQEVMMHPWILKGKTSSDTKNKVKDCLTNMESYSKLSIFNKVLIYYLVKTMSEEEVSYNKDVFFEFDIDNLGVIKLDTFKKVWLNYKNTDDKTIEFIFKELDIFEKGYITYKVFISAIINTKKLMMDEERLFVFFRSFDANLNKIMDIEDSDLFFNKYINNTEEQMDNLKANFKADFSSIKELQSARYIEFINYIKKSFLNK